MKKYVLVFFFLLIPSLCFSAVYNASSCEYVEVKTRYDAASAGDTIVLPPCAETSWGTSYLNVSKAVNIIGAGPTQTILTGTGTYIIYINTGTSNASFPFRISGIQFKKTSGSCVYVTGQGNGWRIDNNRFIGVQDTSWPNGVQITASGATWSLFGLVDNNYFYWTYYAVTGINATVGTASWAAAHTWGDANAVFFENNIMSWETAGSSSGRACIDHNTGGRSVIRHNVIRECIVAAHSACGSTGGTRSMEVYANDFRSVVGTYQQPYVHLRGGSLLSHHNVVAGQYSLSYKGNVGVDNRRSVGDTGCDSGGIGFCYGESASDNNDDASGYICRQQPAAGTYTDGKYTSSPVYVWDNAADAVCVGGANKWNTCSTNADCPSSTCYSASGVNPNGVTRRGAFPEAHFTLNRDYFLSAKGGYTAYTCPHPLAGSGTCDSEVAGTAGYSITGEAEEDETPPTLTSALVNAAGTSLFLYFSESVVATTNTGFAITPSGEAATLTYASGSGSSTLVYDISRPIQQSETLTGAYTQPTNGIEDSAGNDLATIESFNITNQSAQAEPPLRELTVTAMRATVTSAPSGINCGSTCAYEYENGTTVTLGGYCDTGSRNLTITGDCASNGTVSMTAAKACTVKCDKIQVLYLIAP